jgi:uncharacterized protein (TIGR02147 family)
MNSLFEYMNFRDYLRDYYAEKKMQHAFYSFRLFAQKAGFASPNFLKLVIDGKRNMSKESAFRFSKALGHTRKEAEYFENLVFFNQSKTLEEKNAYLANIMKGRKNCDPKKIEQSEFAYYSAWYIPIIRELVIAMDFYDDYKKLGRAVDPAISAAEAEKAVKLLLQLGYIRKNGGGHYEQSAVFLSTGGPVVRSLAVANFHKAMIERASESLERFPAKERDISCLTLGVSESTLPAIVSRIAEFRRELLEMAGSDPHIKKIIQVNFQLFPLSINLPEEGTNI